MIETILKQSLLNVKMMELIEENCTSLVDVTSPLLSPKFLLEAL